jgi:hypothetical protein
MKVFGFTEKGSGFTNISNTLEAEQRFVHGYIEVIGLTPWLDLVCNEEGKMCDMEPKTAWIYNGNLVDIIFGPCFVCRHDNEGNFIDVQLCDEAYIRSQLQPVIMVNGCIIG